MKRMQRHAGWRAGALGLAILAAGCGGGKPESPRLEAFPVRVAPAARGDIEETLTLVGSIKARDEATLYSRVPGKLQDNLLREGDRVRKDEPVALVRRDEVGVRFEPAPVPSTLSGVVGRLYLDRGANVTLQTPVALVVDDSELLAKAEVPERYAGRLRTGQTARVEVEAWPGKWFSGSVSRVSPVVDPATRSAPIEVRLHSHDGRLRSGMFARMSLVLERRAGVLTVPSGAVLEKDGSGVFVARQGKAAYQRIEIGLRTDSQVEVRRGLEPGDAVVVSGGYGLQDGSPVELIGGTAP